MKHINQLFDMAIHCVGMLDFQRIVHLCHYLLECEDVPGDVVEFGSFRGRTAMLMSCVSDKTVHVYDAFRGLPKTTAEDGPEGMDFREKHPMVLPNMALEQLFDDWQVPRPVIHVGWFRDLKAADLPEWIAFAHIDCDLYQGTLEALGWVYPRLSPGGWCVVDDYDHGELPGVAQALKEFFYDKPEVYFRTASSLQAAFQKL